MRHSVFSLKNLVGIVPIKSIGLLVIALFLSLYLAIVLGFRRD